MQGAKFLNENVASHTTRLLPQDRVFEHKCEAALAQRDATIKALRDQLARMQEDGAGGAAQLLSKSSSMPTVIANKQAR